MTLLDFMLVSAGHRRAYDRSPGADAPDMETHRRLMREYGNG